MSVIDSQLVSVNQAMDLVAEVVGMEVVGMGIADPADAGPAH